MLLRRESVGFSVEAFPNRTIQSCLYFAMVNYICFV